MPGCYGLENFLEENYDGKGKISLMKRKMKTKDKPYEEKDKN